MGDGLAEDREGFHGVFEFFAEAGDDGSSGAVGGSSGAAVGERSVGGVGAVESFEAELDDFCFFKGRRYVGVHLAAERPDGGGVMEGLAGGVRLEEGFVEGVDVGEVLLDGLDVDEEFLEVGGGRRPPHLEVASGGGIAEGSGGEEVVHFSGMSVEMLERDGCKDGKLERETVTEIESSSETDRCRDRGGDRGNWGLLDDEKENRERS